MKLRTCLWLIWLLAAAAAHGAPQRRTIDEVQSLIQELEDARGSEQIALQRKLAERYDPRYIWPMIELIDRGAADESLKLARQELLKYGRQAETALVEYLRQEHSTAGKLKVLDILADMQAAAAAPVLVDLAARSADPALRGALDRTMLTIGDAAAPELAKLVTDERLGAQAILYLHNTVTVDALRLEAEKRAGIISEDEWQKLRTDAGELVSSRLIEMIRRGSGPPGEAGSGTAAGPSPATREAARAVRLVPARTLLMTAAVVAVLVLVLIGLGSAKSLRSLGSRRLDKALADARQHTAARRWEQGLAALETIDVASADGEQYRHQKKQIRGEILLGRAEQALQEGRFEQAEDDFEHYCHLTGGDPQEYLVRVRRRRLENLMNAARSQYASGALAEAGNTVDELLALDYTYGPVHLLKGLIALEEGRLEESAEEFQLAGKYTDGRDPEIDAYQALALERAGNPEAAVAVLSGSDQLEGSGLAGLVFIRAAAATRSQLERAARLAESLAAVDQADAGFHAAESFVGRLESDFAYRDRTTAADRLNYAGALQFYLARLLQAQGDRSGKAQRALARARELGYSAE